MRAVEISKGLYLRLEDYFKRSKGDSLAGRLAYQAALRRATRAVGGHATGSHAERRTSATEMKNEKYEEYLKKGHTPQKARELAVQDTIEHLGHSRNRKDLAAAYLSR